MLKRTKIICTQGPSTDQPGIVEALIEHGMDCARFNFSHGSHEEHKRRIQNVRDAAKRAGKTVALLLDTKGPEMRLGEFKNGEVMLEAGKKFALTNDDAPGDETHVSVSHKNLYSEVKAGDRLLLSDGLVELKVDAIKGKDIETTICNSGKMSTRKRVAAPGISLGLPPISEQDEKDIIFGVENDMDFVAASFIQRASDVVAIRHVVAEHGGHMEIIPKIENLEGVNNIDDIIKVADGIMIARGDLGVEIPEEDVPIIQKRIIKKCNSAGKPVIVATQMLETMTVNPRPTRAEVSDIDNAILDGTDAIMLSGETASGKYPVETITTMSRIAQRTEEEYEEFILKRGLAMGLTRQNSKTDAIAHATAQLASDLGADAIITPTRSGYTARIVSKYRPKAPILAFAPDSIVARRLALRWGVFPIRAESWSSLEDMIEKATKSAQELGVVHPGSTAIMTSGLQSLESSTSAIRVLTL